VEGPTPSAVEAVVFDWGGTLSVWADVDLADMWVLAARHLDPQRADELTERLVEVERTFWARVETTQESARLAQILATASYELGLDVTEAVLEEAATHHLDAWTPHIAHDPDAVPVLRALRARNKRIGMLSNTLWPRSFHERFLERDGLLQLIDARLYTSDLEHTKPHSSAFAAVLRELGAPDAQRVVFVGDRLFDDVFGAGRVGMRTVHRPNATVPRFDVTPDATIDRLPSLVEIIDRWDGRRG
jgi:putative hydrolase of the HAD superfamily